MSLTIVEFVNDKNESLALTLGDISGSYLIEDITGLDPVKAEIVSSSMSDDGALLQSTRLDTRNAVFTIGYNPDYVLTGVADLRKAFYSKFMPKSNIQVKLHLDDGLVIGNWGVIESVEAPLFTQNPDITMSVILFDPDLMEFQEKSLTGNSTADSGSGKLTFTYDGQEPTGVLFSMTFNRAVATLTLNHYSSVSNLVESMLVTYSFLSGDVLTIDTIAGEKGVYLTRSSSTASILFALDTTDAWITLTKGASALQVLTSGAAIAYTVKYHNRYGGI